MPKEKNELIVTDISYSYFENNLLSDDKFMDYNTSLGDNLSYEEVISLYQNYTYKKIEQNYELKKLLC